MKRTKLNLNENTNQDNGSIFIDPIPFQEMIHSGLMDSIKMGELINGFYTSITSDYVGCFIEPDSYGRIMCNLYFQDIPGEPESNKIKGVNSLAISRNESKQLSILERTSNIESKIGSKSFDITAQMKGILSHFLPKTTSGKVEWNRHVTEIKEPITSVNYRILLKVSNIDVNKLVRARFGRYDDNGDKYEYNVTMVRPNGAAQSRNFIWKIEKLNTTVVEKMSNEMGVIPQNGIQMFRVK